MTIVFVENTELLNYQNNIQKIIYYIDGTEFIQQILIFNFHSIKINGN